MDNGHFFRSRSKKFNTAKWWNMEFADDTAIVSTSKHKLTHAMDTLLTVTKQWGLTISAPKTTAMEFSSASVEMVSEQVLRISTPL